MERVGLEAGAARAPNWNRQGHGRLLLANTASRSLCVLGVPIYLAKQDTSERLPPRLLLLILLLPADQPDSRQVQVAAARRESFNKGNDLNSIGDADGGGGGGNCLAMCSLANLAHY